MITSRSGFDLLPHPLFPWRHCCWWLLLLPVLSYRAQRNWNKFISINLSVFKKEKKRTRPFLERSESASFNTFFSFVVGSDSRQKSHLCHMVLNKQTNGSLHIKRFSTLHCSVVQMVTTWAKESVKQKRVSGHPPVFMTLCIKLFK